MFKKVKTYYQKLRFHCILKVVTEKIENNQDVNNKKERNLKKSNFIHNREYIKKNSLNNKSDICFRL